MNEKNEKKKTKRERKQVTSISKRKRTDLPAAVEIKRQQNTIFKVLEDNNNHLKFWTMLKFVNALQPT